MNPRIVIDLCLGRPYKVLANGIAEHIEVLFIDSDINTFSALDAGMMDGTGAARILGFGTGDIDYVAWRADPPEAFVDEEVDFYFTEHLRSTPSPEALKSAAADIMVFINENPFIRNNFPHGMVEAFAAQLGVTVSKEE